MPILRALSRSALAAGVVGSVGFLLLAGRNTPRFLLVLFFGWVVAPFAALAWAHIVSERWSPATRTALHVVTIVLAIGALAVYGAVTLPPGTPPRAPAFLMVPVFSWIATAAGPDRRGDRAPAILARAL